MTTTTTPRTTDHHLTDGQYVSFTGPHTQYDRFNQIGLARQGGRHDFGGPIDPNPFPFNFRCAICIDNHGGSSRDMQAARDTVIAVGDVCEFDGIPGQWIVAEPTWSNAGVKFVPAA